LTQRLRKRAVFGRKVIKLSYSCTRPSRQWRDCLRAGINDSTELAECPRPYRTAERVFFSGGVYPRPSSLPQPSNRSN
jgi:hypothetical protein